jgi:tetratricopeptide (TPR) repeat protein
MADSPDQPGRLGGRMAKDRAPRLLVFCVLVLAAAVLIVGAVDIFKLIARNSTPTTGPDLRLRFLEGVVRHQPEEYESRRELAFAYQQAGREREALREYGRVLKARPNDLASLYNTGLIHLGSSRRGKGEKALLRVLELAPTHSLAAKALGDQYAEAGDYRRVLAVVVPAMDAHPELADLQYLAGLAYEKTGQRSRAQSSYHRAVLLMPDMKAAERGLKRVGGVK